MGPSKHQAGQTTPVSEVDAAIAALHRIAAAGFAIAQAIDRQTQATLQGEAPEDIDPPTDMAGRPLR